jgi:hypothetical protein
MSHRNKLNSSPGRLRGNSFRPSANKRSTTGNSGALGPRAGTRHSGV